MSIRKTKKIMKDSSHSHVLSLRGTYFHIINEQDSLSYSKRGIIHNGMNIPYISINRVIIERIEDQP